MTWVKESRDRRRKFFASVISARAGHNFGQHTGHQFDFGDFDRHIFRQVVDVLPGERPREFRFKLVTQRHGIVSVTQNEVLAHLEVNEGFNDQSVFDGAGDVTNIQHAIRSEFS